ncbi:Tetratricopeptide repeat-containing protein [Anoxybacillus pushchinoensis]|jgi:tetratricopeptide (TPR) repeat protein|uniref:Tetratricopeptide repeat-containing protein n=1 Tax=Anoxybacillus pushchinoensis TaxID=150248 RepID=A0A1I0SMU9_9BACL|nr:tetratricopeptide repeat protein [Anoxybacillus pushchinoensis]SFA40854.1 Tetratricopeptide repeat-containing protein [Anoxybacillus pushchinoensis]
MEKLNQIVQLVEQGDVERALALAEQVKQNGSDEERYMLADQLFSWGLLEEAESLVHMLVTRYPDERELQLFLAEIYTEMDKDEEALELLIDIEEDDPYYVRACLLMADLYQMQGLDEVSERKLLKAHEKMPDEPLVQFALAELYFTTGQYQKSLPYYERIINNTKTIAGTIIAQRIAEAYSLLGEFEQALAYYEQALKERFDAHTLFQYGFTAYQAGAYKTAITKLSELKALDREYVPLYLFLAKSYEQEGDIQQSYEIAKEGLTIDEWNKELLLYAGKIALKLGKREEALKYIEQALDIDSGYLEALFVQTSLLFHEERYEDVVRAIQQAIDQGEYDPQFEWELAKAKQKLEIYDQALNHYEEAYTFFKEDPNFLYDFGYFLFEEGRRDRAKAIFEQLLRLDPTNEEVAHMMLQFE